MSVLLRNLRSGAAWMGAAALVASLAAARAEDAHPHADPSVSVLDLSPLAHDERPTAEFPGVDFTPTGATEATKRPAATSAETAPSGEVSHLDLAPAPLPPEAPPPSATAVIAPAETPAAKPLDAPAQPQAEKSAPATPSVEVNPTASPPAPAAPAPEPAVAEFDIAAPLQALLTGYVLAAPAAQAANPVDGRAIRLAVQAFYADRRFAPVWIDAHGLTPAGRSTLSRLIRAGEDGLDLSAFVLPQPDLANLGAERLAEVEALISEAAVSYALQASGARISPTSISPLVTARPNVADPAKALSAIAASADPGEALQAFNPPQKNYQALRAALARLRENAPAAATRPPGGPVLRIGMADPRVPLIRAKFGLGALPETKNATLYDARVATAVAAFQKSKGLAADGALTEATNDALFGDPDARRQSMILATMEMWRWEPRDMGKERVEINVPDYTLRVMDGDDETHRTRVIVGKPDTPTPILSNSIKYLLVNPAWHVPDSIIKKEMAPRLAKDPDYLTRRGFKVTHVGDRLVVEQPPGEANALGHILFMFPNEHAVYLHDTPSRGLFATARRAYSHGCIRVEGPARLAELVMGGGERGWSAARVQAMIGTVEKTFVLPRPLPIHIEYFTEFVDETGALQEREDIYGLTTRVAATLEKIRQD